MPGEFDLRQQVPKQRRLRRAHHGGASSAASAFMRSVSMPVERPVASMPLALPAGEHSRAHLHLRQLPLPPAEPFQAYFDGQPVALHCPARSSAPQLHCSFARQGKLG